MNTVGKELPSHDGLEVWVTELFKHRTITKGPSAR